MTGGQQVASVSGSDTADITPRSDVSWDAETDVLIAGGGCCGLTAALAASEHPDIDVTLVEKTSRYGGNMSLSTGQFLAAETRLQAEAGIDGTVDELLTDILEMNGYQADEELTRHLCAESRNLVHWLVDEIGLDLHVVEDVKYPGMSYYWNHAPAGNNGENLTSGLLQAVESRPNVSSFLESPVTSLVVDGDVVRGAIVGGDRPWAVRARKVIIATDGFAGNSDMVSEWLEGMEDALYYGSEGNTGDGIRMGQKLGAKLAYTDAYQAHATFSPKGVYSSYSIVMNGGILVNQTGERFGDETDGLASFAPKVLEQPGGYAYKIFDRELFDRLRSKFDVINRANEKGVYVQADDVGSLAEKLGLDPEPVQRTVESYNNAIERGRPDETGRDESRTKLEPPYFGAKVTAALYHTLGGIVVDKHGRVTRDDGTIVENLYAGGGATVGFSGHGSDGYLPGIGLASALGFGRLAGNHVRESIVADE